jgi:hypothetical protein
MAPSNFFAALCNLCLFIKLPDTACIHDRTFSYHMSLLKYLNRIWVVSEACVH